MADARDDRERDFWDHEVPSLDACLDELADAPDPNTLAMLDALGDVRGKRVLDFGCGSGVTAARLAQRGARVTAVDLSPVSLRRTSEVAEAAGVGDLVDTALGLDAAGDGFDGAVGRYALHHVDVAEVGAAIADRLAPGAPAAFVETFATNPVLSLSRKVLLGRVVRRVGTLDEHPLTRADVETLRRAFGEASVTVGQMRFLTIFDRQVLRYRWPRISKVLAAIDSGIGALPGTTGLSFHQVVTCRRT